MFVLFLLSWIAVDRHKRDEPGLGVRRHRERQRSRQSTVERERLQSAANQRSRRLAATRPLRQGATTLGDPELNRMP